MKILGISVVKNEDDIIWEAYNRFLDWCDYIAVVDNGSTDRTLELLRSLESSHPNRFFLLGPIHEPFDDSLRKPAYDRLLSFASSGDWWCRLDPDEVIEQNPKTFLADLPFYESVVTSIHKQYYYTFEDNNEWEHLKNKPLADRIRYFKLDGFSEQRFWRHQNFHHWKESASFPSKLGPISRRHIFVRHYKYRSPEQIRKRLTVRQEAYKSGHHNWGWANPDDWISNLPSRDSLNLQLGDEEFHALEDSAARYWMKAVQMLFNNLKYRLIERN